MPIPKNSKQQLRTRVLSLLLIIILTSLPLSCSKPPQQHHKTQFMALGTLVTVSLWDVDDELAAKAISAVESELNHVSMTWHAWQPSTLTKINDALATGATIPADPATLSLLSRARDLARRSDQLFNPAIGKLIALWGFQSDDRPDAPPPPKAEIERLLANLPDMNNLIIEKQTLRSTNMDLKIDLGGFAKGFAVDQAISSLQEMGIKNAIVNAGGDLRAIGAHGERPWRIGIRDPQSAGIIATIDTGDDESVFTSGNYERFFTYDGVKYHHIIDPRTGYPAVGTLSATVIHSDASTADAAATALLIAGSENWQKIARQMGVSQVMLIDSKMRIHMTPEMNQRVYFRTETKPEIIISDLDTQSGNQK